MGGIFVQLTLLQLRLELQVESNPIFYSEVEPSKRLITVVSLCQKMP